MRRIHAPIFAVLVVASAILFAPSAVVANVFFTETVAVEDRSAAELRRAASDALTRVFIRLSGNEDILTEKAFNAAVREAQSHVLLYSYQTDQEGGRQVFFEFDESFIRRLFRDEAVLYWEQERPPIVVWLALDEPSSRRFASRPADDLLLEPAVRGFQFRGVDARFPLLDLRDTAALTVDAIWERDFDKVRRASARYGAEHALVGRWINLSDGSTLVDWYFISPENSAQIQLRATDLAEIWSTGVDLAVDSMRDSLAVTLQRFEKSVAISVAVRGVKTYDDYRAVSQAFEALGQLVDLRIDALKEETLIYRVVGVSSAEQVERLIPPRSGLTAQPVSRPDELTLMWEALP